jgi:hypothetical protein
MTFAQKVHHIVSDETNAKSVTWMPHGRAFKIIVPKFLEREVLPKYFGNTPYSRFLMQLRTSGFKFITQGTDQGCFYHEVRTINDHRRSSLTPGARFLTLSILAASAF